MDEYKTIKNRTENRFVEKKSEFISYICPVKTEDEAVSFINEIRSQNRKATHNCYAYIIRENNISRHSDDGEPGGTAGVPIYEVLRKEGLSDVACVVTRYFGGIMLGAGGLVRAYGKSASDAVKASEIQWFCIAVKVKIKLAYSFYGKIGQLLSDFDVRIENEDFGANVEIMLNIKAERYDDFVLQLTDLLFGSVIVEKISTEYYDFG